MDNPKTGSATKNPITGRKAMVMAEKPKLNRNNSAPILALVILSK
jgi:hypothetical protein